jgi:hypothetical protein
MRSGLRWRIEVPSGNADAGSRAFAVPIHFRLESGDSEEPRQEGEL